MVTKEVERVHFYESIPEDQDEIWRKQLEKFEYEVLVTKGGLDQKYLKTFYTKIELAKQPYYIRTVIYDF